MTGPSNEDERPPQPKVQRVVVVEEVKETVEVAVQDTLKNFSASAGGE